jgi:hypothetical protein
MDTKYNCCFCGTVKNCGKHLEKVLKNIETIGSLFSAYKIIISYDISSDNSLDILQTYQITHPNMILYINTDDVYDFRVYNIAKARNKCLDIVRNNYSDYEYFIMIDCDDVCSDMRDLEPLKFYLTENETCKWDAISFNRYPYYDLWALSKYPYSFGCMHFKDWKAWGKYIEIIIAKTKPKTLISCLSAFNGFAVYKTNKFINCYYDPRPRLDLLPDHLLKKNEEIAGPMYFEGKAKLVDCEHRSFHLMAKNKNNAKIFIAPEIMFNTLHNLI